MRCKKRKTLACSITSIALVITLSTLLAATMLFTHIHVLPDGKIVVHSHAMPFNKTESGTKSHSHTQNGFLLCHTLYTLLFYIIALVSSFLALINVSQRIKSVFTPFFRSIYLSFSLILRAPPAIS